MGGDPGLRAAREHVISQVLLDRQWCTRESSARYRDADETDEIQVIYVIAEYN